jgi:hypothetical protein
MSDPVGTDDALMRVFLDVADPRPLVDALERGVIVPTRAHLELGARFLLALRVGGSRRSIDVPAVVVARRLPRGAQRLLSAGIIAQVADPQHPMMQMLRDVASGRVVDLDARLQAQVRVPARTWLPTLEDALAELRGLLDGGASFSLPHAQRGDKLSLSVMAAGLPLATVEVLVRRVSIQDGHRTCAVELVDERGRPALERLLARQLPARRA